MIALILHNIRRSWVLGILATAAAFGFEVIANRVFAQIQEKAGAGPSALAQFMPKWVQSAFDINPQSMTELNGFLSVCVQHPFLMVVLLALPVALLSGWLTGDVENRSLALVLVRPVSRFKLVAAAFLVMTGWSALGILATWAGCLMGAHWTGQAGSLNTAGLARAIAGLAALIFAFMGIAAVVSASLSVRGDAVGWCITIILLMYVWNFLAQVWYGGGGVTNYSLFRFYEPTKLLLQDQPLSHGIWVLASIGASGWILSAVVYRLRSFTL